MLAYGTEKAGLPTRGALRSCTVGWRQWNLLFRA